MSNFKNDLVLNEIKEILADKSKDYLINELLRAFWSNPNLLNNSIVWSEYIVRQKQEFLENNK